MPHLNHRVAQSLLLPQRRTHLGISPVVGVLFVAVAARQKRAEAKEQQRPCTDGKCHCAHVCITGIGALRSLSHVALLIAGVKLAYAG